MQIMKRFTVVLIGAALAFPAVAGADSTPPPDSTASTAVATPGNVGTQTALAETSKLSEDLVYSVDRTAERLFDTSRSVSVITIDELWRKNGRTLTDVLANEAGIIINQNQYGSSTPMVRGLSGKQVQILIDGVKVNSSTYGTTREYVNFIDINMIERIEVVRGVVSVLGTESLGGVVNIITRKGPAGSEGFGAALVARYSSADHALNTPVQIYGQGEHYRYFADVNFLHAGDLRGGGAVGRILNSGYKEKGGSANVQYLFAPEKTLTLMTTNFSESGVRHSSSISSGSSLRYEDTPIRLQTTHLAFEDISSRPFADSLRVAASWTVQETGQERIRSRSPSTLSRQDDRTGMYGLNLELGKFVGSQHFVYGVDYSTEKIHSISGTQDLTTSVVTPLRGNFTDDSRYQTMGVYANDRVDIGKWLTTIAGVRYGTFRSSGSDVTPAGPFLISSNIDSSKGDVTGALNLIFHVGSHLNIITNAIRGFRAPNIEEMSHFTLSQGTVELPATNLQPEHVISYESGVKFDTERLAFSGFYYRNRYSNLIARIPGTYHGLSFLDYNGDGVRENGEPLIQMNQNRDIMTQKGYDLEARYRMGQAFFVRGTYTYFDRADSRAVPAPHDAIGTAVARYTLFRSTRAPWVELENLFETGSTTSTSTGTVSSLRRFHELNLRAGIDVMRNLRFTATVENVRDRQNTFILSSSISQPGRQVIVATEWKY